MMVTVDSPPTAEQTDQQVARLMNLASTKFVVIPADGITMKKNMLWDKSVLYHRLIDCDGPKNDEEDQAAWELLEELANIVKSVGEWPECLS